MWIIFFQGRFKGILVEEDSYILELARYIVLNPFRAGMVSTLDDWPWSSYRATTGMDGSPSFLQTDWILHAFGKRQKRAVASYRRFFAEGVDVPSPWLSLKNQIYLGSDQFVDRIHAQIDKSRPLREKPQRQRHGPAKPLTHFTAAFPQPDQVMAETYRTGAYSMQAISDHFGVGHMTVSRAVRRFESDRRADL